MTQQALPGSRFGKMILLLHKTTCQLLGTIELHCVSKTLTHHRGSQNNFRLFNGSCFRICMTCNRRKFDRLTMKTDLFQKQAPKMACFGCNKSGFPDFGRSCRSNWWHQVKYRGTLKSFGCNACNELCERHQKWASNRLKKQILEGAKETLHICGKRSANKNLWNDFFLGGGVPTEFHSGFRIYF